jgi:hypothetical protein
MLRKLASRPVRCGLSHDGFMTNMDAAESAERSSSGHRILLAITGLTPQVVTETIYALMLEGADALPHDVDQGHTLAIYSHGLLSHVQLVVELAGLLREPRLGERHCDHLELLGRLLVLRL